MDNLEKKSNHQVKVVRIKELLPHGNADKLALVMVGGYQVVVNKTEYNVGDLAVYIQPDSVVPEQDAFSFLWDDKEFEGDEVPIKYRRITVRKFRGQWSEGLMLPVNAFPQLIHCPGFPLVEEGDDVSDDLNITHYSPPERVSLQNERTTTYKLPKTFKGWVKYILYGYFLTNWLFYTRSVEKLDLELPKYDVDAYKNYVDVFQPGEMVYVTEKIHGSNARYIFKGDKMYAGSHNLWKSAKSNCVWRKALEHNPIIELWCRANKGYALYGEVAPTQKEPFTYGTQPGRVRFFLFDVLKPDGTWMNWQELKEVRRQVTSVPLLYEGEFDAEYIKSLVDGQSLVSWAKHIREGIVVCSQVERHVTGLGRAQLKLVSNKYYEMA